MAGAVGSDFQELPVYVVKDGRLAQLVDFGKGGET
jgi:hypothetical protein